MSLTVISDAEPALPDLIRRATGNGVTHILDWWHISMRVRHAEQALQGVYAQTPTHCAGLDIVNYRLSRIRHPLWNGYHEEAREELFALQHLASEAVYLNGEGLRAPVARFLNHCDELRSYLRNNETALIDYGSRYRAAQPVSDVASRRLRGRDRQRTNGKATSDALVTSRSASRSRRPRRCS